MKCILCEEKKKNVRTVYCISSFVYKMAFWQSESNIFKTFFKKGYLILYGIDFIVTVSMKMVS